jgi:hypothetical protein
MQASNVEESIPMDNLEIEQLLTALLQSMSRIIIMAEHESAEIVEMVLWMCEKSVMMGIITIKMVVIVLVS